jgi:UDP-glucose 4-epimerase
LTDRKIVQSSLLSLHAEDFNTTKRSGRPPPRRVLNVKWHLATRPEDEHDHHHDIANATNLALGAPLDGRVVNIVDEAPSSVYELVELLIETMEPFVRIDSDPWYVHTALASSGWLGPFIRPCRKI